MRSENKMIYKTCIKCGEDKSLSEFHKDKSKVDGYRPRCKQCRVEDSRNYYEENRIEVNKGNLLAYYADRQERLKKARVYRQQHLKEIREKVLCWQRENQEKHNVNNKRWYGKMRLDPTYRLNAAMRRRLASSLKHDKKSHRCLGLVDYTIDQLKSHLEKQFKNEMTWNNYGTYWEVDHKIPIAVFNFETPDDMDFKRCWSLKNLQPLEARENRLKGARIDKPFQPSLLLAV